MGNANTEPLKLWHFQISFSFLTYHRESKKLPYPSFVLLPQTMGMLVCFCTLSSLLLATAVDPTHLVQIGHTGKNSFKLGLESCFKWHVSLSRVFLRPTESQFIESFSLSEQENWMGLCSATWCWGWYGNKGSKNDGRQMIFSCVINSCVKLLWKLSSKLG